MAQKKEEEVLDGRKKIKTTEDERENGDKKMETSTRNKNDGRMRGRVRLKKRR